MRCWFNKSQSNSLDANVEISNNLRVDLRSLDMGSGCGSVGRAVDSDTRDPRFDSSHRQNFIEHLFIINCIEKTKINKKRPGMAHFFIVRNQDNHDHEHNLFNILKPRLPSPIPL